MPRRRICVGLALVLSLILSFAFGKMSTRSAATEPTESTLFNGKTTIVHYLEGSNNQRVALVEQVQVRKIGERFFLTGKAVGNDDPDNPIIGHTGWLPVENILAMCEANSTDDARNVIHYVNKSDNQSQNNSPFVKDLKLPSYLGTQEK